MTQRTNLEVISDATIDVRLGFVERALDIQFETRCFVNIYLCPDCDKTHIGIQIGDTQLVMIFTEKEVEEIVKRLLNPHPVHPNDLA